MKGIRTLFTAVLMLTIASASFAATPAKKVVPADPHAAHKAATAQTATTTPAADPHAAHKAAAGDDNATGGMCKEKKEEMKAKMEGMKDKMKGKMKSLTEEEAKALINDFLAKNPEVKLGRIISTPGMHGTDYAAEVTTADGKEALLSINCKGELKGPKAITVVK